MPIVHPSKYMVKKSKVAKTIVRFRSQKEMFKREKDEFKNDKFANKFYVDEKLVKKWFNIINREIFKNKLEMFDVVRIGHLRAMWGECYAEWWDNEMSYSRLKLNHYMKNRVHFINVLAHEMVHLYEATFHKKITHGPTFYEWRPRLAKYGIWLEVAQKF